MKRRDFFVAASSTVLGAALSRARAATPCPPPSVSIAGGGQASTSCTPGTAPAWYTAMQDATWGTVAATANVAAVAPSPSPGGDGQAGVMTAWCGGSVDTLRQELVLPAQGGHTDYFGNEVYTLALNTASPAWARVTNPRYAFGSDALQAMDDGSPRSNHGNSQLCYAANVDRTFIAPLNYTSPLGYSSEQVYAFNRAGGAWELKAACPNNYGSGSGTDGGAVYDPVAQVLWLIGAQSDSSVDKYDPVANTHTLTNVSLWSGYSGTLAISPSRRLLVYISGSAVGQNGTFKWLDLTNITAGWRSPAAVTGNAPTGYGPGLVWHDASGSFLGWNGTPATTTIKKLTPPATPATGTWAWTDTAPASGNSVTPTASQANGTFGRFNIVANLGGSGRDVIVLVNAVNQATYVFKLPAGGV